MYAVSGASSAAVTPATASTLVAVVPVASGKVFWLRMLWISPQAGANATAGPLILTDATVGATVTDATGSALKVPVPIWSLGDDTAIYEIPEPGIRFATNCVCSLGASGSLAAGEVGGAGYYE